MMERDSLWYKHRTGRRSEHVLEKLQPKSHVSRSTSPLISKKLFGVNGLRTNWLSSYLIRKESNHQVRYRGPSDRTKDQVPYVSSSVVPISVLISRLQTVHDSRSILRTHTRSFYSNQSLPSSLTASKPCVETINISDNRENSDKCSWTDLWRGAVAIDKLCIQKGRSGVSFEHGTQKGSLNPIDEWHLIPLSGVRNRITVQLGASWIETCGRRCLDALEFCNGYDYHEVTGSSLAL